MDMLNHIEGIMVGLMGDSWVSMPIGLEVKRLLIYRLRSWNVLSRHDCYWLEGPHPKFTSVFPDDAILRTFLFRQLTMAAKITV